jgi:hypothetical protein
VLAFFVVAETKGAIAKVLEYPVGFSNAENFSKPIFRCGPHHQHYFQNILKNSSQNPNISKKIKHNVFFFKKKKKKKKKVVQWPLATLASKYV